MSSTSRGFQPGGGPSRDFLRDREPSFEALLRGLRGNIQRYRVRSTDVCDPLPVPPPRQAEDDLKVKSGFCRQTTNEEQ